MTRLALALALASLCLAPLGCGGPTEVETYPNAEDVQEGEPGGSEPIQDAIPPDETGGPHPTDDEIAGDGTEPF